MAGLQAHIDDIGRRPAACLTQYQLEDENESRENQARRRHGAHNLLDRRDSGIPGDSDLGDILVSRKGEHKNDQTAKFQSSNAPNGIDILGPDHIDRGHFDGRSADRQPTADAASDRTGDGIAGIEDQPHVASLERGNRAENWPHVDRKKREKLATRGQSATVHDLTAERDKRLKTQQHSSATRGQNNPATRGQKSLRKNQPHVATKKPYIEAVGASVGTMAFRIRWRENGKRSAPVYLSWVSNDVFQLIKKGDYDAFKKQLISNYVQTTLRSGDGASPRANSVL